MSAKYENETTEEKKDIRVFIALAIPENILKKICQIQNKIDGVRWINKKTMHLTIYFIGEISPEKVDKIGKSLNNLSFKTFNLYLDGVKFFHKRGGFKS